METRTDMLTRSLIYFSYPSFTLTQYIGFPLRYGFATLLSLYNKWMFSPQYYGFSYPLFVTFMHMLVQFSLAWAVRIVWREKYRPMERPGREDYV